jgi:hypothetical protein
MSLFYPIMASARSMSILRSLLHAAGPLRSVKRFTRAPMATQCDVLRGLLQKAAATEWGQRYDFAAIATADDVVAAYQERMPLHTYDSIRDDVKRVRQGAEDVMWPGRCTHFAVSSGTVSEGKIIPISTEMIENDRTFSVGTGVNYVAETGNLSIFGGQHLTLPGRIEEDPNFPGTLVGEVSGLLAEHAPQFFSTLFQAVPNEVSFLPNWEEKLRAIAERTVDKDIRLLVMVPTWALVLFEELIQCYNERYDADVSTVKEVWPNVQLFISGGVALRSYRDLLEELIGGDIDFIETYGASEGFFSFQNKLDDPAMLLHLDNGLFYEFVRMDEKETETPRRYTIDDVETGVRYALYVTSCSGLWSYDVGDVVRFTQTDPPKIMVAGRTSEMIDRYGEAVFGDEARAALQAACDATDAHVTDYHVAPRPAQNGGMPSHEWLVEFEQSPADMAAFAAAIDQYLQDVNRHYQIRREARAFGAPTVEALPDGTFYAWLKETKDRVSGQTKVPRMSDERTVADAVLRVAQGNG